MKALYVCMVVALLAAGSVAQAAEGHKEGPCRKIKEACEAAGFMPKGHKQKKGLMADCMKPIIEGGTVEGVTVSPEDVQACKEKRDARKAKKAAGK